MTPRFSRRSLLGGALGLLSISAIAAARVFREPRHWIMGPKFENHRMVNSSGRSICYYGQRSDGMMFMASNVIKEYNPPSALVDVYRKNCLHHINSYLDSECDCRVGFHCEKHKWLRVIEAQVFIE